MKSSLLPSVLNLEIRPSRIINAALIGFALCAMAAIFYAAIPWLWRSVAIASALIYAAYCRRLQLRQCGRLQWRESWSWQSSSGPERLLQLRSATLWPGLIVLVFRDVATRRHLTFALWRDSLDIDDARQLRVCLRHAPVFAEELST
jgi:hypothetical protein